ncbi:RluA family pseudouridine synthase [Hypericibacter terrae]|uniref:RluA family pseudouridine synthase n=1 Tax=Hypericibacter terrae TaxID=2602015 RepID=UPI001780245B|nr:RluA family pseudouridine synthase [Hypericibacter terrae]
MEAADERRLEVTIEADQQGERVDRALAARLPDLSRSRLKSLIEEGRVQSGERTISDPSQRVKPGQNFVISIPDATAPEPLAEDIPLVVRYEDDALIVIDKPAGMVVHPAPGNEGATLVNALIAHCGASLSGIGGVRRPGIVHRLDKDTSGLLVAAKHDIAHRKLAADFASHDIERAYQAVVWGVPAKKSGEIEGNIGRHPVHRKKMTVLARGGKPALTRYRVLKSFGRLASLVECRLATGRTHQIRVHLASIGHPLLGDPTYGRATPARLNALPPKVRAVVAGFKRQALHAWLLGFEHPVTGEVLRWESPLPSDMQALISSLESI